MTAKITDIRLVSFRGDDGWKEIRVAFDNDRHHAVMILPPYTAEKVARALFELARNINADPHLNPRKGDQLK